MTPTGLPQKGDKMRHKSGREVEVVKREGNDSLYSLIVRVTDGGHTNSSPPFGYDRTHFRLLEAAYWIQRGDWTVLP